MVRSIFPSTTKVGDTHAGKPVIDMFVERFPQIGRDVWLDRFTRGLVMVEGEPIGPEDTFPSGTRIQYHREIEKEPEVDTDYKILYQDEHILVADKPHGLPTTPSGEYINRNLTTILRVDLGEDFLAPVHRIDRDTTGLCLFARTRETASLMVDGVRESEIHRTYQARVKTWGKEIKLIDEPISRDLPGGNPLLSRVNPDGKESRTRIISFKKIVEFEKKMDSVVAETSLDEFDSQQNSTYLLTIDPITGRQHQIRVHLAHVGHPIIGDTLYNPDPGDSPLALKCSSIEFLHPIKKEMVRLQSNSII